MHFIANLKYSFKNFSIMLVLVYFFCGCSQDLSVTGIKKSLQGVPNYSIILENMKVDGNFFKSFYHKYRVVQDEKVWTTDWQEVSENDYRTYEKFLGMTLSSKKDNVENTTVSPPGYQYVGNQRYGRWQTDSSGNSFWEFYGKYRLMSDFFGGWYRPIYRNDYNNYRNYRSRNAVFYGSNKQYGTSGNIAKKAKPDYFQRQKVRAIAKKSSFADKVSKRVGRTKTSYRARSGSYGK